ncbi:aldose epimerase family protein [Sinobaca sp. H24]|uniref:aldose epimerase family protein n=1 Tax=Sinobaca sp. H24 TaxID=2923376 RepID=UPI0020797818|nr:aldose epimerase family protein [Sinobaca sp. H24]
MIKQKELGTYSGEILTETELSNDSSLRVTALNLGCRINGIYLTNEKGEEENLVLAYEDPADYLTDGNALGAVVGRVAGRIPDAEAEVEGKKYSLTKNHGDHHLHGGEKGFANVFWDVAIHDDEKKPAVVFSYTAEDGEEGYPGRLEVTVTYTLDQDTLTIDYKASSDKATLVSLTNHSYFNLSGDLQSSILNQTLKGPAEGVLELDAELIPTGEVLPASDIFPMKDGEAINTIKKNDHPQLLLTGRGLDHFFVWAKTKEDIVFAGDTGIKMTVQTTEPGAVIYTAAQMGDDLKLKNGPSFPFAGLCIETQRLPAGFSSQGKTSELKAGETYQASTSFHFAPRLK